MAKTREQKEQSVKSITEKLKVAKSVVFADYKGLTMKQLSDLRKTLKTAGAEFDVTKNTLMEIALKESKLPEEAQKAQKGPIATLFSFEDEITPVKALVKALKDAQMGKIIAGLFNGEFLDTASVTRLSALPGKQELRGQVVGLLVSPLRGMVTVLSGNTRNLVYALEQIRLQKGGE